VIDHDVRDRVRAAYDREAARNSGKVNVAAIAREFDGEASRATVNRICKERAREPAQTVLPPAPPGTDDDLLSILREIADPRATLDDPIANRVRHVAGTALAMAKEDERTAASAAEALAKLRRVQDLFVRLEDAIEAVPEPVKAHLIGRLEHSGWNSSSIRLDVRRTIEWVKVEALEQSSGGAYGPGTVRKRLLGDAIDYLAGEVWALLRTARPDLKLTGDDSGPLADMIVALWSFATGQGDNDIPMIGRRAARQIAAERIRAEAKEWEAEITRLIRAGLPAQRAMARADEKYAESQRAARGRFPRKSQSAREKN
jgi:hypothetical protein